MASWCAVRMMHHGMLFYSMYAALHTMVGGVEVHVVCLITQIENTPCVVCPLMHPAPYQAASSPHRLAAFLLARNQGGAVLWQGALEDAGCTREVHACADRRLHAAPRQNVASVLCDSVTMAMQPVVRVCAYASCPALALRCLTQASATL
jgi:hypothetical protein